VVVFKPQQDGQPMVTVAMPIYNAGKNLRLSVMSVIKQSYPSWELLIVDDGSTDDALRNIADIKDGRIRVLKDGKNKGLAARLNECIDLSRGKYFARMDQDDVSYPERFSSQIRLLIEHSKLDLVAVRVATISEEGAISGLFPSPLVHSEICARPWIGFHLPHPTWMGKTEWFRKHRYKVPQPYFCEDQELLLRSYGDSCYACVPAVLFAYRLRTKINLQKLLKTRLSWFQVQFELFRKEGQTAFIFLAWLVCLLRMGKDLFSFLANKASSRCSCLAREKVPEAEQQRWEQVLQLMNNEYS
jgi:glycosyltransferase involved in cell wall biosynthesis